MDLGFRALGLRVQGLGSYTSKILVVSMQGARIPGLELAKNNGC